MSAGDTQPTVPLPDLGQPAPASGRRGRRSAWPWIIAGVIVAGLAVAAWFAAEAIARNLVVTTIREQIITRVGLPEDQQIDVEVPGAILPQLISGTFGELTISSEDVALGSVEADVTVHAQDVPVREGSMTGATATAALDQEQLQALLATVDGFPADAVSLDQPDVSFETALSIFGASVPLGVSLTPSVEDGDIVLTPASLQLAGTEVDAERLQDQFGAVADAVLRDWTVCIADQIPAGLTLTGIAVESEQVVATFDVSGDIAVDPAQLEAGTCD